MKTSGTPQTDFTFVTCGDLPDLDPDDRLAMQILQDRGFKCAPAIWNDNAVDWSDSRHCVLRSTWDYHLDWQGFIDWIRRISAKTNVVNKPALLEWNTDKRYLIELSQKGLPVVPTCLMSKSGQTDLCQILIGQSWNEAVVKPVVGLATFGVKVARLNTPEFDQVETHCKKLLEQGDVLVQKYMPSVTEYGERALIFLGGKYSHAVRKSAFQNMAVAGHAGETAAVATQEEIALGQRAIATLPEMPVYARVDMVPDAEGAPVLMELELVEPSLFLSFDHNAPSRFVDALLQATQAPVR